MIINLLRLLFKKKYILCDFSNGMDYSVEIGYKKLDGKLYIVSEKITPPSAARRSRICGGQRCRRRPGEDTLLRLRPSDRYR